eukprot:111110_1
MYNSGRLSLNSIVKGDNLDNFNDEFESLLENHELDRKRSKFVKERLSIISGSSNPNITNNSKFYNMNKFNKKNDNNKKKKSFNKGGHDELEDIKTKLQTLQNILKYLPNDSKTSCNNNNNDINESEMEATCSGFLVVVGGNISEATRFYAELVNNILYLKREPNSKIKHVITISFIQSNVFDNNNNNNENEEKEKNAKYMDLFVAHLESRS